MQTDRLQVKGINNVLYADQFAGADLGAQINAAIADLPSGGGTIVLPAGTFNLSTTVNVTVPVTFRGAGRTSTIINDTRTNSDTFSVQSHRVVFYDLSLQRSGVTTVSGASIHIGAFNDHAIVNCNIRDSFVGVVTDSGQNYLFISRSLIQANQSDGLQINGPTWMYFNQIYFNAGNGMTVTQGGGLLASHGNEYFGNRGRGIDYFGNNANQAFHIGDVIDSSGGEGLFVQQMSQFTFTDGWIASSGVTFSGALGTSPNYTTPTAKAGAVFDNGDAAVIFNNNWLINNGGSGVFFNGTPQIECSHNRVAGNNQAGASNAGIAVTDNGVNKWASATLTDNRVWDAFGLANPTQHQATGLLVSGGAGGFIEITGGDYTGNTSVALSDTSTATKKYIGAAGIADQLSGGLVLGGSLQATSSVLTPAAPTVSASQVGLGTTTATSATAGANGAVPAQVAGYLIINVAGTAQKIPYFNT